jgi:hypothetical protein
VGAARPSGSPHRRQRDGEEVTRVEAQAVGEPVLVYIGLERRSHDGKVEPATRQLRVAQRKLNPHASFGRADVDDRSVALPRELLRDRPCRAHAQARHGVHELREEGRVVVLVEIAFDVRPRVTDQDLPKGSSGCRTSWESRD